jgi:hypothetical protein
LSVEAGGATGATGGGGAAVPVIGAPQTEQ